MTATAHSRPRRRRMRRVGVIVAATALAAGGTATGFALASGDGAATAAPATAAAAPASGTGSGTATGSGAATGPAGGRRSTSSKLISDTCRYSHEANDDPIMQPGRTDASMAHDFFGNTTTSATSTAAGLVGGATTCSTSVDASAYWTPVLYQDGRAITPTHNLVYWASLHAVDPAVTVPPVGLQMIAGNEMATAPQSTRVVDWRCAPEPGSEQSTRQPASATPVDCAGTRGLELRITFPSCWDGHTLGGASQTNVVYPSDGSCPAGHPVRIPTVVFHVVYPITSAAGLTLSMGPGQQGSTDTAHGDFINGWDQPVLSRLITGCAGPARTCGHVTGSDARVHPRRKVVDRPARRGSLTSA